MAGDYSFGSAMGGSDDPTADTLSSLLTYGANSDDETPGQPNSAPNVKSDASAPIAPVDHVAAALNDGQPQAPAAAPAAPPAAAPSATPVAAPSQASQAPTYTPPDTTALTEAQGRLQQDQKTSNVQPKWWERTLGGLTAGAMAFGHVPGAVEAGQAVTNRGQNAAEDQRGGRVRADQAAIQAWQDGQKQQQQTFQNQHTAFEDQDRAQSRRQLDSDRAAQESQRNQAVAPGSETPDDPKNPLGTWHATTVGGKPIALQGPPDKWAKSPAGISAQREADIKAQGLTGDDAKYYRANGKLKEPGAVTNVHVPSEGQQAYGDALTAWKTDNPGKKPTLNDLRTIRSAADGKAEAPGGPKRGTAGQFATLDKETAAQYAKAEADYKAATDSGASDADKASALAALNAEKARVGAEHSQRLRDLGGIPAEDSQPSSTQQPKMAPQNTGPTPTTAVTTGPIVAPPKPGAKLTDPAIAKQYLAAAGGDKAKARQLAQKDKWQF